MKRLVIIGAGGHGKVAADCAREAKEFDEIVFLDGKYPEYQQTADWKVVAHQDDYLQYATKQSWFFVAIGHNDTRKVWQKKLAEKELNIATLIHPNVCIAKGTTIGVGSLVLAGVIVNISSKLGEGCILNTGSTVDHDCDIGDFSHIAPGVNLAGGVSLGNEVFIGVGSSVIPCLTIGDQAVIGAGSTVLTHIPNNVTAVGTPAKVIKRHIL